MSLGKKILLMTVTALLSLWMAFAAVVYVSLIGGEESASPADFKGSTWQCRRGDETLTLQVDEKRVSRCYTDAEGAHRLFLFTFDALGNEVYIRDLRQEEWSSARPRKGTLRLQGFFIASPYEMTIYGPYENLDTEFWQADENFKLVFQRVDRVPEGQSHWMNWPLVNLAAGIGSFVMAMVQLTIVREYIQYKKIKKGERRLLLAAVLYPFVSHFAAWALCMNAAVTREAVIWVMGAGLTLGASLLAYPVIFLSLFVLIRTGGRE